MVKKTSRTISGTSFHGTIIEATPKQLIEVLGNPNHFYNDGQDKVNIEWDCETEDGEIFTIYDWKEYRILGMDEYVQFHIGGFDRNTTDKARVLLYKALRG